MLDLSTHLLYLRSWQHRERHLRWAVVCTIHHLHCNAYVNDALRSLLVTVKRVIRLLVVCYIFLAIFQLCAGCLFSPIRTLKRSFAVVVAHERPLLNSQSTGPNVWNTLLASKTMLWTIPHDCAKIFTLRISSSLLLLQTLVKSSTKILLDFADNLHCSSNKTVV